MEQEEEILMLRLSIYYDRTRKEQLLDQLRNMGCAPTESRMSWTNCLTVECDDVDLQKIRDMQETRTIGWIEI